MNFNIKLESIIKEYQIEGINLIFALSQKDFLKSLNDLYTLINEGWLKLEDLSYGISGSHIWISDKYTGKRILLITKE